ncbi:MAG: o-succinylbenzoate synthase [Crocinitomicaceae bacterium]|nr:o-succinylbenzoate synthase [Crocinitomicaceae bacterium]
MLASYTYTPLEFKIPAGTSRGILTTKHSWLITIQKDGTIGTGECSIIPNLTPDYVSNEQYEKELEAITQQINSSELTQENASLILKNKPSLLFGVECAFLDLQNGGKKIYFNNNFANGIKSIPINGLIWMGNEEFMQKQIAQKLKDGYTTIKMKIGAIDFATEYNLLKTIRNQYDSQTITLRVDANGAFSPQKAPEILEKLAKLSIHSIEQPIKAGNWQSMHELCTHSPIPIALDEELIGVNDRNKKIELLETIQPHFIILKPSLHGGISGTKEWIELSSQRNIPWWMTSALESNIGLKAICELTAEYENTLPQGLGTGSLYVTNFKSQLKIEKGMIFHSKD